MLAFFRRAVNSPAGIALLGLVLLAFVILGVSARGGGFGGGSGAATGDTVATAGGQEIDTAQVQRAISQEIDQAKQAGQQIDPATFVGQGGVELTVQRLTDDAALIALARRVGLVAGRQLVDGEIASAPAFAGPDGRFSDAAYRRFLATAQVSDAEVRADLGGGLLRQQLILPISGAVQPAGGLVRRYAALRVEERHGAAAFVPAAAFTPSAAPTDHDVQAFYQSHLSRYSLPERRQLRYALFGLDTVAAKTQPTDAEVQAVYKANAAKYATRDVRRLSQVVFTGPDAEAQAKAFAAKAQGAAFGAAAGARLIDVGEKTKAEFADFASPAVADAAWAAAIGGTAQPARSPFGWNVVHVDGARTIPGKSLAEARPEIVADLTKTKSGAALYDLASKMQDELGGGQSLDAVAKAHGLAVVTTPAILPDGTAPEQPGYNAPPELAALAKPAFQADPDDPAAIVPVTPNKTFAVLAVGAVSPAAPRPLAAVRDTVVADLKSAQAAARAKAVAQTIVAQVSAGKPIAGAVRAAGVPLPEPQPVGGRRVDLERQAPSANTLPLRVLFTLTQGHARLVPAPGNGGWYVVKLDTIVPADPGLVAQATSSTAQALAQTAQNELLEEFAAAARALVRPNVNPQAIQAIKGRLTGAQPAQ